MNLKAWQYFLTLERDFEVTTGFVEPHQDNFGTYSDRFAGLLLLIGSEVDVVAKAICSVQEPDSPRVNMKDCSAILLRRFPRLHSPLVMVPRYRMSLHPFEEWAEDPPKKLAWWDAYNKVKHDRLEQRHLATQRNVLLALAGLLVLNLYHFGKEGWPHPFPALLDCGFPDYLYSERLAIRVPGLES